MPAASAFLTAFNAGLSAPVALFATSPAPYHQHVVPLSAAQSFAVAGSYLSAAMVQINDDGRTEPQPAA